MKQYKVVISKEAPSLRDALWAKPVSGGFVLYLLDNGKWNPLKIVDDAGTSSLADDTIQNLVGTASDTATDNTINGAKKYADSLATNYDASGAASAVQTAVTGTVQDDATALTLYGLSARISALENL